MKHSLQKELQQVFEAPPPLYKKDFLHKNFPQKNFLQKMEFSKISMAEFTFSQIGYIRKWTWSISTLIFVISLTGSVILSLDMLWVISAFSPVLALTVLSESGRSENYEMAELEMATRFSLRSVLFARSGILGTGNLALFCLLMPLGLQNNEFGPLQAGVSILTPFLLTSFIGLWIVRRFRGRETMYFCAGIAACISVSVFFSHMTVPQIYQENHIVWWLIGILLLCIGTVVQYCKVIRSIPV